jgi:hypothetical protein
MRGIAGWVVAAILAVVLAFVLVDRHRTSSPGGARESGFPSCSSKLLFAAVKAKENLSASRSVIAGTTPKPGAYGVRCDHGWAVADVSRPGVGETDGETLFRATSVWAEAQHPKIGGDPPRVENCYVRKYDHVPPQVADYLLGRSSVKRC